MLNTCNGTAEANEIVRICIPSLGDELKALIMESTPPVMTIGKRVMEEGYGFIWQPFQAPMLYTPAGKKIQLEVVNNVPYLVDDGLAACAAEEPHGAASSSSSGSRDPSPLMHVPVLVKIRQASFDNACAVKLPVVT